MTSSSIFARKMCGITSPGGIATSNPCCMRVSTPATVPAAYPPRPLVTSHSLAMVSFKSQQIRRSKVMGMSNPSKPLQSSYLWQDSNSPHPQMIDHYSDVKELWHLQHESRLQALWMAFATWNNTFVCSCLMNISLPFHSVTYREI